MAGVWVNKDALSLHPTVGRLCTPQRASPQRTGGSDLRWRDHTPCGGSSSWGASAPLLGGWGVEWGVPRTRRNRLQNKFLQLLLVALHPPHSYTHRVRSALTVAGNDPYVILIKKSFFFWWHAATGDFPGAGDGAGPPGGRSAVGYLRGARRRPPLWDDCRNVEVMTTPSRRDDCPIPTRWHTPIQAP